MKKSIFSLLIGICISIQLFAQESKSAPTSPREDGAYLIVDKFPEFPGGMVEMTRYLSGNTRYPAEAHKQNITGTVLVQFVVEKDGKLDRFKVMKSVHPLLDDEAVRVAKSMPLWTPGKHKGKVVPVVYNIPISFKLNAPSNQESTHKKITIEGDSNVKEPKIEGFWQLFAQVTPGKTTGTYEGFALPILKTFLPGGLFQNLVLGVGNSKTVIAANGKYEQISDNTYIEKIDFSVQGVANHSEVKLNFEFLNSNLMKLTFSLSETSQAMTEYWIRITPPAALSIPESKDGLLAE